ncbi:MAG: hypothetical protein QOJ62_919 [Actinomycetota bacterium]|nr:hypothetical protein [Actinomycetota bacterium]
MAPDPDGAGDVAWAAVEAGVEPGGTSGDAADGVVEAAVVGLGELDEHDVSATAASIMAAPRRRPRLRLAEDCVSMPAMLNRPTSFFAL